jgi:uncharacterized membrane protein YvlD (DUF360 family)
MDDEKLLKAYKRVKKIKGFYIYLIAYFVVNIIFFIINLVATPGDWWFFYPLAIMTFVLFWVTMDAFVFSRKRNSGWEKRKLKEIIKQMDEEK